VDIEFLEYQLDDLIAILKHASDEANGGRAYDLLMNICKQRASERDKMPPKPEPIKP
jgi:hypothetical protein